MAKFTKGKTGEFNSSVMNVLSSGFMSKFEGRIKRIDTIDKVDSMSTEVMFIINIPNEDAIEMFRRLDKALTVICWGEDKDGTSG